jgi:hypothetical protein
MKVIFLANGNTMVFDEDGKQVPKLQESWLLQYLEANDINPIGIEITMPDGCKASVFETCNGYNWNII